ncbi:glycerol-3-phosphate dehydrogenase [candidate division WOR-1 bacterium RIFOXYA12_FULL_52_29]|uniref:Glycerol-3-phosphate dehydrogenase [NAD(P)+] n=1 Tax=candidate division WOR-1 bacterium RIFOXYC12_FULL_54_18 TaxID=1802584 RepID=A0A1F4T6K2_UNCSA|nr:MAG: glycerol-3-phosphate dehydrogenase [candidate division WOR-1 bacterium RIFOXYA2_FULL_51_19]OGC17783.1 MAG: glycerol-3-phosphate dehydrogenase [candidate division WOR-1 bacterium RIFOXYA12_FULL_52_29]OGC26640.1 MAG: glycerol-3-phosphate dehydrogenase [candidate division WOR-1 bacterium RIFOXYB2_FULL_45_9]OGC28200.1 MAG: glycerol-3-phosphate dehydrogenase [candidate division WOR-1 bacterium RIFOXYC12_FULL_54_18]OGC29512.1 MAG: glycerol-3-phosphate dehydrogenase [candidate division WOR-1 b
MKVAIVGAGAWGTTLALLFAENKYPVTIWAKEEEVALSINESRENKLFLPGFQLPALIEASPRLTCLKDADLSIFVVPTQYLRRVVKEAKGMINRKSLIVSAGKGIEEGTRCLPAEIISDELGGAEVAALSGPNLSKEIAKGLPAAAVVAAANISTAAAVQKRLISQRFRVYTNDDVVGVQLGGALKNVIAIASGIVDGLRLGDNAKAAMLVRGLAEITRLGVAMGGRRETFAGLSGMGDLITTCSSQMSRNHQVGQSLAEGKNIKEILAGKKEVAEGVATSASALALAREFRVELPITEQVYNVIHQGKKPYDAIAELMNRDAASEIS